VQGHSRAAQNARMTLTPPSAASVRRCTLASAILGSSVAFMDGTVINVALPAIQRSLVANLFVAGFRAVMVVAAGLALAGAACAAWLIDGRAPSPSSKGRAA
jgi:hypothetical protein